MQAKRGQTHLGWAPWKMRELHIFSRHAAFGLKKDSNPFQGTSAESSKCKRGHDHKIKAQFIEDPLLRDSGRLNLGSFLDPVELVKDC